MLNRVLLLACATALVAPFSRAQLRNEVDTRALAEPAVGEASLAILSPTMLQLTRIGTSDGATPAGRPGATTAVLDSPLGAVSQIQVSIDGKPAAIKSSGWKRRVLYAPLAHRDLRYATYLYLELSQPIAAGTTAATVEVVDNSGAFLKTPRKVTAQFDARRLNPAIHVNEEGYAPDLPKRAMVGYYLGDLGELELTPASGFTINDARTGAEVFKGPLALRPDSGFPGSPPPYQDVLEANFSDFKQPGEYRLQVPGLGASLPFVVDDGIAMGFMRTYLLSPRSIPASPPRRPRPSPPRLPSSTHLSAAARSTFPAVTTTPATTANTRSIAPR